MDKYLDYLSGKGVDYRHAIGKLQTELRQSEVDLKHMTIDKDSLGNQMTDIRNVADTAMESLEAMGVVTFGYSLDENRDPPDVESQPGSEHFRLIKWATGQFQHIHNIRNRLL